MPADAEHLRDVAVRADLGADEQDRAQALRQLVELLERRQEVEPLPVAIARICRHGVRVDAEAHGIVEHRPLGPVARVDLPGLALGGAEEPPLPVALAVGLVAEELDPGERARILDARRMRRDVADQVVVVREVEVGLVAAEPYRGLAIVEGPDGNLWFTEFSTSAVGRITPAGRIRVWATSDSPASITVGADGALWFNTNSGLGRITVHGHRSAYSVRYGRPIPYQGLAAGPDGRLWFIELAGPTALAAIDPRRLADLGDLPGGWPSARPPSAASATSSVVNARKGKWISLAFARYGLTDDPTRAGQVNQRQTPLLPQT